MNVRYRVELSEAEHRELTALLRGGRHAARTVKRAQILLAADAGDSEQAIARHVAVSASTVCRTKRRFVEGNLERALSEEPRPGAARRLSGRPFDKLRRSLAGGHRLLSLSKGPSRRWADRIGPWNCWLAKWCG